MPSYEHSAVIVDASAWTPSPTPSAPTPRITGGHKPSDSDSDSECYKRHSDRNGGLHVHHRGVVHRYVHHLRIRRLNYIGSRARCLLYLYLLLLVGLQVPGLVGLAPQALDGCGDRPLICRKRLANCGVVVNIFGHHRNHPREGTQGEKCRIEALLLRCIGQRLVGQGRVRGQPVVEVQNLLRISGRGRNLRQQRVWIQSDGRQQLVQLRWRRHRSSSRCGLCHRSWCSESRREERKK
jgi:hypothetical protein